MKCLPAAKIPGTQGRILHDWHAEILALRAFNYFLLQECLSLLGYSEASSSIILQQSQGNLETEPCQPFSIRKDVKIHMYSSEAPCGDASMELVMNAQEDATPWPIDSTDPAGEVPMKLRGRENFSELGSVRRKPGKPVMHVAYNIWLSQAARGDSIPTFSKSCSDKIALKQCTSLLSSSTCSLISPENAYLETMIIPRSQYIETSFDRAFGPDGRMGSVVGKIWSGGYSYRPVNVRTTKVEFEFCRRSIRSLNPRPKGSNISAVWTPSIQETLINGVLQGRKQVDPRGASAISRKRMWGKTLCVFNELNRDKTATEPELSSTAFEQRKLVKSDVISNALKGWIKNKHDGFDGQVAKSSDSSSYLLHQSPSVAVLRVNKCCHRTSLPL